MTKFFAGLSFFLAVLLAAGGVYHTQQVNTWKTALREWQAAVEERDAQLAALPKSTGNDLPDLTAAKLQGQLDACNTERQHYKALAASRGAIPQNAALTASVSPPNVNPAILTNFLQIASRISAAVRSGVSYIEYSTLLIDLTQARDAIWSNLPEGEVKTQVGIVYGSYQRGKALWNASINKDYPECGKQTSSVRKQFPDFVFAGKDNTNLAACTYYEQTLSFMWQKAAESLRYLNSL